MPAPSRRLTALFLPLIASAAVAATASSAEAAVTVSDPEVCQYSYDQYWRVVPVTISGTLKDVASGSELAPGAALAPGQQIALEGATVTAELPDWIAPFAFDGGVIPYGSHAIPVRAWIALEATGTSEGTTAPIELQTEAVSHVAVAPGEAATPETAYFDPVTATIPTQRWTASGGDVRVRQALATKLAPIPAGRDGGLVPVNGSLFISAELDAQTRLYLDCLSGDQRENGAAHGDRLPPALASGFRVPSFAGAVDGTPFGDPVDATVESSALPRAAAGTTATVDGTRLRLRLTAAQRSAWLGGSGTATIGGNVTVHGARSQQGTATAAVSGSASASGSGDVLVELAATGWTPTGSDGVDLRTDASLELTASNGTSVRRLQLTRTAPGDPYPFAHVLGPDPRVRFEDPDPVVPGVATPPPSLGGLGGFAPPPVLAAKPKATKRTTVKTTATTLRRSGGKLTVKLTNLNRTATTSGRLSLVTKSRLRVGKAKRARRVSLVRATAFSLAKGRSRSYRIALSKDATALLRRRPSLKATLTLKPAKAGQQTVVRTVTVRR